MNHFDSNNTKCSFFFNIDTLVSLDYSYLPVLCRFLRSFKLLLEVCSVLAIRKNDFTFLLVMIPQNLENIPYVVKQTVHL